MSKIEEIPSTLSAPAAPPAAPAPAALPPRRFNSIPLLLHLLGEEAAATRKDWALRADGHIVKTWNPTDLGACRKLVGLDKIYEETIDVEDLDKKVRRSDAEKVLINKIMLLFLYGGIVTDSSKTPKIPVTFAADQYMTAIILLFANEEGTMLDTSVMIAQPRVRAFESLFNLMAQAREGQLAGVVQEFFRLAVQNSPADTIRVIDANALKLLYGEIPADAPQPKAAEVDALEAAGATEATRAVLKNKTAFAIGKATPISDAVIRETGADEANNAAAASIVVLDDAGFDPANALQTSLNLASLFQQATAVAKSGTLVVLARHGDQLEEDQLADALIVPQLRIMKAKLVAQDKCLGVWQMA